MSQGEILLVEKQASHAILTKNVFLDLVKQSCISPWLPQLVDAVGCPMTINTYELGLVRGEALLLLQFSSLLLCGFASSKIEISWWVSLEASYFTIIIVWFTLEFDFNACLRIFG